MAKEVAVIVGVGSGLSAALARACAKREAAAYPGPSLRMDTTVGRRPSASDRSSTPADSR